MSKNNIKSWQHNNREFLRDQKQYEIITIINFIIFYKTSRKR